MPFPLSTVDGGASKQQPSSLPLMPASLLPSARTPCTLAWCLQVCLPMPFPGSLPLSVSLVAMPKKDLVLLHAAIKLGALLADEAAKLAATDDGSSSKKPSSSNGSAATSSSGSGGGSLAGSPASTPAKGSRGASSVHGAPTKSRSAGAAAAAARSPGQSPKSKGSSPEADRAELYKEDGNAALNAGRVEEAVRLYSLALQLDPKCAVYHANRALAYLKLGMYGHAEGDCDAALALELSVKVLLRRGTARMARVRR